MQSSHNPHQGYHCNRFDTDLLQQIVAVEIDLTVRRIARDKGVIIDEQTQRHWIQSVLERLERQTFEDVKAHSFLPSVLQERMHCEINRILHEEILDQPATASIPQIVPMRRLCFYRPVLSVARFLFEKRAE